MSLHEAGEPELERRREVHHVGRAAEVELEVDRGLLHEGEGDRAQVRVGLDPLQLDAQLRTVSRWVRGSRWVWGRGEVELLG